MVRIQYTGMHIGPRVQMRTARESDAAALRDAVKSIAAEKWYLATVDGFSLEQTRAFLRFVADGSVPQMTAFVQETVVGFCDIVPDAAEGFMHVGRLGMGVRSEWRRKGIGGRLLNACLSLAREAGMEKIELEVFADNVDAVRLYESRGFREEGLKIRARKFEGRYQDFKLMALWL